MHPHSGTDWHHKTLLRWSTVSIEGIPSRVIFRYEKLVDLCYYYDHLDHLEKDCQNILSNGKRYCGPWLRANGQHLTSLADISTELDRLNSGLLNAQTNQSPKTFSDKGVIRTSGRFVSLVPFAWKSDHFQFEQGESQHYSKPSPGLPKTFVGCYSPKMRHW